ncbi:hypothetical protein ACFVGY_03365 [Streptomyces sp. NPDC127106]|uniref:hypothetical protein n=1 Tax=Streptomyces sp. NPDC127106 TaxID=3345360 RepID=UPI00363C3839
MSIPAPEDYAPVAGFRPTHVVPQDGMPAWETPDVSRPTASLDAFLPVQLLSRRGEWAEVLCANGWSAWVDGRLLVSVPQPPPTGGQPRARTDDPRPLIARSAGVLDRYRRAVEELAVGRLDGEGFRSGTKGLRAGVVVDGEDVWLYDESTGHWMYGDGTRLAPYAATGEPDADADASAGADAGAGPGRGGSGGRGGGGVRADAAAGAAGGSPHDPDLDPTRVIPPADDGE